ncbi:MAG TPA: autotransporter domain-containing protein [Xanthobacteraceae bacterium]|nr:autotransporter domain-containing protein [Xanthobacteraceae bacterium]
MITTTAGDGILVGGNANISGGDTHTASVAISSFGGGVTNSGTISATGGAGIHVGGNAAVTLGSNDHTSFTLASFGGSIANLGTISASGAGIWVGGNGSVAAGSFGTNTASVTISTFAGGVTNSGLITAGGAGILLGGTATGAGAGNTASVAISSFSGNVSNAGTIVGLTGIHVTGGVTFVGGAAIVNSGNITGTGGTAIDVSAASSPVTIDQNAGTISGAIRLSANADVLDVSGGVIAGNIVGQGSSDTVNFSPGAGNTFTFAAPFGFSGVNQVNINSGTVVLNGTNSATTINVNGGTLAGTGTLNPTSLLSINSGGAFAPGTPGAPGTSMTIGGNLAFQSGALYVVYLNPSASSMANVTGTAALAGSVQANFATGAYSNKRYDILHSAGLNGTTFNSLTTVNPPNFSVDLSYSATDVFLNLTATLGLSGQFTINQQNVATALNTFFNNGGALPPGFASVFGLSGAQLANALTQLDGENATGAEKGAFSLTSQFLNLMLDPFVDGRGDPGAGGGLGFAPGEANNLPPAAALAYASVLKAPPRSAFAQRWTTWAAAFGGTNQMKGDPIVGSTDITASAYGLAAGVDYHVTPDTVFGIALAGGGTNWGLAQGLGTGRSDALLAGVYGVTHAGPAYVAAALSFANNWFTTNRTALADQLTAKFDGQSFGTRLEGGYRFAVPVDRGFLGLTPYAALQAQSFHTPSYSETDLTGGGFGLSYNAMTGSDTRGELGLRLDAPTILGGRPLMLRGKLAWAHDWVSNPALNATFEALPGVGFTVFGAPIPHDSALASAGAQLFLTPSWSLAAKFDGAFAPGAQTYAGTGTLRYSW